MWISDFAIRRPIITVVTMLALVVFGLFALVNLDTDEFPEVNPPVVSVALPYPGASPDVVEREVVEPIEEAIASISGIDRINSQSLDGFAIIIAEFDFEKDVQQATQDIRDQISQIRGDLPQEMEEPILTRFDPNDLPIMSLSLTSRTLGPAELTRLADPGITRELRGIAGVAEVEVVGGLERELVVELRPQAMQAAGISVGQVVQALQTQNLAAPVGRLEGGLDERTIRLRGRLETPVDFAQLVVAQAGGRVVRLGEVAAVRDGTEEQRTVALFSGQEAVGINITKAQGYSTTAVSEQVRNKVEEIKKALPKDVDFQVVQDAGERVESSVSNVQETLLEGAFLTVLVVFLFLNSWRSTVITGLALPVSVLASFVAVWAYGFTLNTMSLLGLSLAIGILIDDAIVVRENIVRHVEMGKDHYTAAREGTAEIGLAVAATTFSIVVVFIPIGFMSGMAGQWFKPLALTIACSVLVSLFVSFSLDPMLSAYGPDPHREEHQKSWITRKLDRFNAWFDRQAEGYKRVIGWALDHRLAMVGLAVASFVGALALPMVGAVGGEFFPVQDVSEFNVVVDTPPGSNLAFTRLKAEEAAALARTHKEVAYTYTTIGGQSGAVDEATVYVRLLPKAERDAHQRVIEGRVREQLGKIGGATAGIQAGGFGGQKQIQIQLQGPDVATLNRLAEQVQGEVAKVPGAVDVGLSTKGQKPELDVVLNRGVAGSLGVTAGQVAQALRPAFAGIDVGDWVDPQGETRDVTVRVSPESRARISDLETLPLTIQGPQGPVSVPLGQVAQVEQNMGPAQINRLDRERVINVEANTSGRPLSEVVADIQLRLDRIAIPAGYTVSQGGETEDQGEVFGQIF
ncbi:MAG TPA: efflux RND transporter permease subunit, partial [Longimicrobiaceae bacterium]